MTSRFLPVLRPLAASSAALLFLVAGPSKKDVLATVRARDPAPPTSHITTEGELIWALDEKAAGHGDG